MDGVEGELKYFGVVHAGSSREGRIDGGVSEGFDDLCEDVFDGVVDEGFSDPRSVGGSCVEGHDVEALGAFDQVVKGAELEPDEGTYTGGVPGASEREHLRHAELEGFVRVAVQGEHHAQLAAADSAGPGRVDRVGQGGCAFEPLDALLGVVDATGEPFGELRHGEHGGTVDPPGK